MMNAETKKIIHQLRNGYGLSDEDGRALRLAAAELIEDRDAVLLTLWAVLKSAPGAEVRVPVFCWRMLILRGSILSVRMILRGFVISIGRGWEINHECG